MIRTLLLFIFAVLLLAAAPAQAAELVVNGDLETGDFGPTWVHGAYRGNDFNPDYADHIVLLDQPYSGNYSALLGFKHTGPRKDTAAFMYCDITIPTNVSEATLNFKFRMQGYDGKFGDRFVAQIRGTDDAVYEEIISHSFMEWDHQYQDSGWLIDDNVIPFGFDLSAYAGQNIRLYFEHANGSDNRFETWTYVDEISLIYKKYVDMVVDGNGEDVFGDVGTGGGGISVSSGLATDTLLYSLVIENEGNVSDSYAVSAIFPAGWTVGLDDAGSPRNFPYTTGTISPSARELYLVYVIPAPGTPAGSYDVIIDAVSTSQANRFDSVTLRANVVEGAYGVDLAVDGDGYGVVGDNGSGGSSTQYAPPDSVVSFSLELFNSGMDATRYIITYAADPGIVASIWFEGTQYVAPFTTPVIPAGTSLTMVLEAEVPGSQPGGDYITIISAVTVSDTLKKDTVGAVLRLRFPRVDMIICGSGDDIYDDTFSGQGGSGTVTGENGSMAFFPLQIQNESALSDSFALTWDPLGSGWTAYLVVDGVDYAFPYVTATFGPYETMNCGLKLLIAGNFGTYASYLHAVSQTDNRISESVTAAVNVSQPGETDLVIDGSGLDVFGYEGSGFGGSSIQTVTPGDTTVFIVEVMNLSGTNSFDISWNTPPGWTVTLDGQSSPISEYPAGDYELKVFVPQASSAGTFDVIVDGKKSDKPFFLDSVLGRVIVVFPVDALIDGNGEDICGPLGSGLGGSSVRETIPSTTANFSVEIQNEGSTGDQYGITWNSIPLWNATLEGSGSPYTTGIVSAGSSVFLTFSVDVAPNQALGDYQYIIDISSLNDPLAMESIEAIVTVVSPPRADMIIDGNGAGVFGLAGTGEGGTSVRGADAGSFYTAALEVRNVGSFPDSFYVEWQEPPGWPASSIVINDGAVDHSAPFWTPLLPAAGQLNCIVKVQVPADAGLSAYTAIINSWSALPPNYQESVKLVTQTFAMVTGFVFDDRDHDGVLSAGDVGLSGVVVREEATGLAAVTGGGGAYSFGVPGGTAARVIETNPSGYISLSPDSVGPVIVNAGDTLRADFADVLALSISQGSVLNGIAGGYVDFAHVIVTGTGGHVELTAVADSGVVTMFFLDENADGIFDGNDRLLESGDGDLDPAAGNDKLYILFRVFIPPATPVGATLHLGIIATQSIAGTPLESRADAFDAVVVVGSASGLLSLQKEVDKPAALPGEVITYTIRLFNSGIDSVQNIVLCDPVSPFVDLMPDAFGPGMDVEWSYDGAGVVYLTLDEADGDECEYHGAESLLQMLFSKNGPFYLPPGRRGMLVYKARVK